MFDVSVERAEPTAREKDYAFVGAVIRVTQQDFVKFKKDYPHIPDLKAAISTIDAYYDCNGRYDGKYWWGMLSWLKKDNDKFAKQAVKDGYGPDWF